MNTYWAFVRVNGYAVRTTVNADNPYNAYQLMVAMYGRENMVSDFACPI